MNHDLVSLIGWGDKINICGYLTVVYI